MQWDPKATFTPLKSHSLFGLSRATKNLTVQQYNIKNIYHHSPLFFPSGVPITVQWDPKGYFYAIQISQFGLSHYTKNLTDEEPVVITCEDAEEEDALKKWRRSSSSDAKNNIKIVYDEDKGSNVVEFRTSGIHNMQIVYFGGTY